MAPFFAADPFPRAPPTEIRLQVYRYRFATPAERRREGIVWKRERTGSLGHLRCAR
jgi:hypothetical protein